jgi:AraC family transcriptional activator of pobA
LEKKIPYFASIDEAFNKAARIETVRPHFELFVLEEHPEGGLTKIKPFRLNAFVIGMITGGSATLTINSKRYQLKRGSLYFSSPWDIRSYADINGWKGFLLFFTPDYLNQFHFSENKINELRFFQPDSQTVLSIPEDITVAVSEEFEKIKRELNSLDEEKYKILFHYIHILLYRCKKIYQQVQGETALLKPSLSGIFLEKVNNFFLNLFNNKSDKQLTIQSIAEEMHIHPHYLSDLVKKQTGKTASQIIRERYVHEAKILLRNTNMSVSEISYYLHFNDTSNFTKFFKNICGYTPREYKEKQFEI